MQLLNLHISLHHYTMNIGENRTQLSKLVHMSLELHVSQCNPFNLNKYTYAHIIFIYTYIYIIPTKINFSFIILIFTLCCQYEKDNLLACEKLWRPKIYTRLPNTIPLFFLAIWACQNIVPPVYNQCSTNPLQHHNEMLQVKVLEAYTKESPLGWSMEHYYGGQRNLLSQNLQSLRCHYCL